MYWTDPFALVTSQLNRPAAFMPAADIAVSENDLVLTMDLPGFTVDDLTIEVQDDFLTIRGDRRRPEVAEGTSWVHVERPAGAFERRIRVPKGVEPDGITASLVNGVLSLIIAKPERMKPKAISIGNGDQSRLESTTS